MEVSDLVIGVIGSVLGTLIIGIYIKMISWMRSNKRPIQAILNDHNIYGIYKDGTQRQLTYEAADINPILVKKKSKIIFLRCEKVYSNREYTRYKLMSLDLRSMKEQTLIDQKPFRDGLDASYEILQPRDLTISPDNSKVLFLIEKYATGSELVQVDIKTGKFDDLFSVEKFDIIKSGKYKKEFLVGVSEIRDVGRKIYYKICDCNGKVLKEFDDFEEYMEFRSDALVDT